MFILIKLYVFFPQHPRYFISSQPKQSTFLSAVDIHLKHIRRQNTGDKLCPGTNQGTMYACGILCKYSNKNEKQHKLIQRY